MACQPVGHHRRNQLEPLEGVAGPRPLAPERPEAEDANELRPDGQRNRDRRLRANPPQALPVGRGRHVVDPADRDDVAGFDLRQEPRQVLAGLERIRQGHRRLDVVAGPQVRAGEEVAVRLPEPAAIDLQQPAQLPLALDDAVVEVADVHGRKARRDVRHRPLEGAPLVELACHLKWKCGVCKCRHDKAPVLKRLVRRAGCHRGDRPGLPLAGNVVSHVRQSGAIVSTWPERAPLAFRTMAGPRHRASGGRRPDVTNGP